MGRQTYKKYVYYLKSTGICIVVMGSCWFLCQLRQMSQILRSTVPTNALNLEQAHAQYIYIDDPRYKDVFMFRKTENLQTFVPEQSFSFSHVIMKWWKSLNRNVAYKLLHMAQNGDKTERLKAMHTLNSLKYLKDWHYQHIAQMLDAKIAVSLARMPNVDTKFFLKPPYYHAQHKLYDVIEKAHCLLLHLNTLSKNTHPCLIQFLNNKFRDSQRDGLVFDHDLSSIGLAASPAVIWDQELLQSCVQALCHHSCLEQYSKDIVEAGGLQVLMMIKKIFNDNINICILLAKIISNISLHSEYLEQIFQAGWVGALVEWSHNFDIRLSVPASRALANLDDENECVKYPRRVYLLHPLYKTRTNTKLDVVFLHGLLGGVFVTWRQRDEEIPTHGVVDPYMVDHGTDNLSTMIGEQSQEFLRDLAYDLRKREWARLGQDFEVVLDDFPQNTNEKACGPYSCSGDDHCVKKSERDRRYRTQCWPKDWLPEDVPYIRVIGVNYDSNLSMWTPLCPIEGMKATLRERSEEYIGKLVTAGIGTRQTIWVCHSMGGLLVKKMLVDEWKNGDKNNICKNTRGIIFYSTPHRGSRVAVLTQTTQMLVWPSVEVQELREESPHLLQLHEEFLDMLKEFPIEIVSFSETKSTLVTALKVPFQFVTSNSADPGVGEFYEIAQDHLSICKPASRHSFLYQKLLSILKRHVTPKEETKISPIMELLSLPSKLF
ncbi:PREDICTED: protein SERAC1-like [Dufourea novaeangliae]|uniref:Protein SERAC1 n=1 Tax=Dufourea novaeangliae TaxID=178035 RepID=A0A154PQ71_DUFNO|nr:PREDICTED: protein SERAC1-like [Dufourea novaeangliae]KZC14051.1 Protein SERAC1 [Dufourea novaeangliae]